MAIQGIEAKQGHDAIGADPAVIAAPGRRGDIGIRSVWGRAARAVGWIVVWVATAAGAASVSEPDTVLYGRVTQRVGDREFWATNGVLTWTLRSTTPTARVHRFTTRLRPLDQGRYSYVLRIPHQLLAFDLGVQPERVALTAAGQRLESLEITLDGQPLALAPQVAAGVEVGAAQRAAAQRVDLEIQGPVQDSDGDGLPDAWEDSHGLDKWDPTDGASAEVATPAEAIVRAAQAARTFAEWRAVYFPTDARALDVSAADDPDHDGLANLVEYAFELDPTVAEADGGSANTPRVASRGDRRGIAFRRRAQAMDLDYRLESAADLKTWTEVTDAFEVVPLGEGGPGFQAWLPRNAEESTGFGFLRLRVLRR